MACRPDIHRRRSIRLLGHDYRMPGAYFITVCTHGREPLFGHVAGGAMHASDAGRLVQSMWDGIPAWFPHVVLDEFIIMPDHIHGILRVEHPDSWGAASSAPYDRNHPAPVQIVFGDCREPATRARRPAAMATELLGADHPRRCRTAGHASVHSRQSESMAFG